MKRKFQSLLLVIIIASIFFSILPVKYIAFASDFTSNGNLITTEWIASGAKLEKWNWYTESGKVKINVIEVDLQNPYIKIDSIIGKDGKTGNKQKISEMAEEEGAIAAINGDYFTLNTEGAPFGVHIQSGELFTSPGYIHSKNALMITQENIPFIDRLDFDAEVKAEDGSSFQLFGINKTQYQAGFRFSDNSHTNRLHMYTDKWNMENWVGDSLDTYTIVLVEDGVITKVLENEAVEDIPKDAFLLLGDGEAANFLQEHAHQGESIQVNFSLNSDEDLNMAIDGSTLLVDQGEKASITYEIKGNHARTAVGYSQEKRFLYMVSVEKNKESVGMTLDELSDFLISRGLWKAVNLDGGGSTTMVSRPLGTFNLVDTIKPAYGAERSVPNGLALFSTAPKGELIGWELSMPKGVLLSEEIPITINSAYDEYYNPTNPEDIIADWGYSLDVQLEDGVFTFNHPGTFDLKVLAGKLSDSFQIKVYNRGDVEQIKIDQEIIRIHEGESFQPTVTMYFNDDSNREVPTKLLEWKLIGAKAAVEADGTVLGEEASTGILVASYQGFSTAIPVVIGAANEGRLIDSFNNRGHYLTKGLTDSETISFEIDQEDGESIGTFTYDFGPSENLRIAYLQYGTLGKHVIGEPAVISLKVKGDNSGHWLRSAIHDINGEIYYIDLAKQVDWSGWKTLTIPLPSNISYPINIKSLYVVHLENTKDQTVNQGQLSFKEFIVKDWNKPINKSTPSLQFTLNKNEVVVGSEKKEVDQGPIVVDGRAFIPIRHMTELLGGNIEWVSKERKVQITKDYKVFDFWLDEHYMSLNGIKKELDVSPFIRNGRTMIPLRAISEGFGLYINYDSKTKNITIH